MVAGSVRNGEPLDEYLRRQGITHRGRKKRHDFTLARLESGLQHWKTAVGASMNALRSDLRALGINLVTGQQFGSAGKLAHAIGQGAPHAKKERVKQYHHLKCCLVDVPGWY